MNTQEYVEKYAKEFKSNYIKYFAVQLIIDITLMAIYVFLMFKFMDKLMENNTYLYIGFAVFMVLLGVTFFFNIKKFFGSFKNLVKDSNIYKKYNDALKSFKASNNKVLFDEKLCELEQMIKEQYEN